MEPLPRAATDDGGGIFKPLSKRCCTDIICLLIFFVYLAGMIVIGIISLTQGQMDYVFYPLDYKNKFCGKDSAVSGRPYAYYPRLDRDIIEQMPLLTSPTGFLYFRESPPSHRTMPHAHTHDASRICTSSRNGRERARDCSSCARLFSRIASPQNRTRSVSPSARPPFRSRAPTSTAGRTIPALTRARLAQGPNRARAPPPPSTHGAVGPLHVLAAPRELALPLPIGCKHEIHFPTG